MKVCEVLNRSEQPVEEVIICENTNCETGFPSSDVARIPSWRSSGMPLYGYYTPLNWVRTTNIKRKLQLHTF